MPIYPERLPTPAQRIQLHNSCLPLRVWRDTLPFCLFIVHPPWPIGFGEVQSPVPAKLWPGDRVLWDAGHGRQQQRLGRGHGGLGKASRGATQRPSAPACVCPTPIRTFLRSTPPPNTHLHLSRTHLNFPYSSPCPGAPCVATRAARPKHRACKAGVAHRTGGPRYPTVLRGQTWTHEGQVPSHVSTQTGHRGAPLCAHSGAGALLAVACYRRDNEENDASVLYGCMPWAVLDGMPYSMIPHPLR